MTKVKDLINPSIDYTAGEYNLFITQRFNEIVRSFAYRLAIAREFIPTSNMRLSSDTLEELAEHVALKHPELLINPNLEYQLLMSQSNDAEFDAAKLCDRTIDMIESLKTDESIDD